MISLLNANGLKATTVQDPLSHTLFSDMLLITETWLTPSMLLPTNWPQYHCYGQKVKNANNRGKGGITALFNPLCKHTVLQLPSPNDHTLSLKVGDLRVHCLYLPPSMPINQVFATLDSIPLLPNTILCGDFNARLGSFVGDHQSDSRGNRLLSWCSDHQLRILNESLAHGVPIFSGFRLGQEISSIVDFFITNIAPSSLLSAALQVESDLSLSSDHRLMHLTFDLAPSHDDVPLLPDRPLAPRRLWNLNRLKKPAYLQKYRESIKEKIAPLTTKLENWVSSPTLLCPSLDLFNESFNACVYDSLYLSVGNTPSRPSYWHKYWTTELQEAAESRDRCYKRWRRSIGIDKRIVERIQKSLETNFSKATKTISRIKSRNTHTASFTHTDGPMKAVDIMSTHLSSVYSGSSLPAPSLRPPSVHLHHFLPHSLDNTPFLDDDVISWRIKELPNNKAPGPDHIKAEMLKPVIDILASFFKLYFTLCYQWSNTPSLWRQATVFPIFKKGDRTDPANYRPISLTSVLRKLFEMTIVSQVTELSPALDHAQGGFRKQRSPLDQALCLHDLMHDYFNKHYHFPSVAFLDIKQAYDTVDRRVVWNILASTSSFPVPLLNLLIHMFDDVSISVLLANHRSDPFTPITGLLQGSVLSPHLYSLYIDSLPGVLRSAASDSTPEVFGIDDDEPVAVNSLLFADDVAIFGTKDEVEKMLQIAGDHSLKLGYRWSPSKCAILNAPSPRSSRTPNFAFTLYGEPIPTVDQFCYLGMEFTKKGLNAGKNIEARAAKAKSTMSLLTSVGVHRNGFSLLLSARLYKTFIRPKIEYGLAISCFTAREMSKLDTLQNSLVSMFVGSKHTAVAKHITCLPGMLHRYNTLVTKYVLRSEHLPEDSLLILLQESLSQTRLGNKLQTNALYTSLPDPIPTSPIILPHHTTTGKNVLLRASRPSTFVPDPILYLPMNNSARSRLCPCADFGQIITRDHFLTCRAIDADLIDSLPVSPPGVNRIDFALNSLPTKKKNKPPAFWPKLLSLLWMIDTLCHPLSNIPEDPDPGSSWFNYPR
ncbi:hypothetical protein INT47_006507 [Mucor saturninus]|uniref:Reverse transcriptase domain-containing protein n=1 Tax=Mucor saturninus TaxID=64648 RepID=A0A8H7QH53_9FUNG|nr:hypothetical protein INT47_006507 [Mucor saturninus]